MTINPWQILETVTDPEIPVLSIVDLGIVREVRINGNVISQQYDITDNQALQSNATNPNIAITITPTYSGCPAMYAIEEDIKKAFAQNNLPQIQIITTLSPPWTTDWLSMHGRQKLKEYGIAPPEESTSDKSFLVGKKRNITCPFCNGQNTELISQFGSTACKALHRCKDCLEPFDYFKCH